MTRKMVPGTIIGAALTRKIVLGASVAGLVAASAVVFAAAPPAGAPAIAPVAKAAPAATGRVFVFCKAGGPATTEAAHATIALFLAYLGRKANVPDLTGDYYPDAAACERAIVDRKPAYAALSLGVFLEHEAEWTLVPRAQVVLDGRDTEELSVWARRESPVRALADLAGRSLHGTPLGEPRFVARVAFAGALGELEGVTLVPTVEPLKALRAVSEGRADAVMLDAAQAKALDRLPLAKSLARIWKSAPLPNPPFVTVAGRAPEEEAARLTAALAGMCADAEGAPLCRTLRWDGFRPAPSSTWDAVRAAYEARAKPQSRKE